MGIILATNPHRVFLSRLGRIEVFQPIPPPDGKSPDGPHTHVLPGLLRHRRTHAATEPIPDGLVPCAHVYPAHPAKDGMGQPRPFDRARHDAFQAILRSYGDPKFLALKQQVIERRRRRRRSVRDLGDRPALCAHQHPRDACGSSRRKTKTAPSLDGLAGGA